MSNEISLNISGQVTNPNTGSGSIFQIPIGPFQLVADQAAQGCFDGIISVATAAAAIAPNALVDGDEGLAIFQNLDTTNYVEIGPESDGATIEPFIKLYPNGTAKSIAVMSLTPAVTLWARANTAACKVRVLIFKL